MEETGDFLVSGSLMEVDETVKNRTRDRLTRLNRLKTYILPGQNV